MIETDNVIPFVPRTPSGYVASVEASADVAEAKAKVDASSAMLIRLYAQLDQIALPESLAEQFKDKVVELLIGGRKLRSVLHELECPGAAGRGGRCVGTNM
ncbi:hypothetical protein [Bradyrhizobium sp. OK095]|jgi:hypothetical protein|uniref:hypothetical protein n=1 Tax=Bradyrhizobium sp. OK095 TaxID=1882760 RepID=UPI0008C3ABF2|nr:hypothetical protein [Bradyrhizobium sp. OK095]SEN59173.1 hypothetical protein SAMN05443254_109260 [Bradyrhizobium sp. OK095]